MSSSPNKFVRAAARAASGGRTNSSGTGTRLDTTDMLGIFGGINPGSYKSKARRQERRLERDKAKKLQEAGYTIAIYTQDIQAKNTTRSLEEIISPGTYFSSDTHELTNNVMCVWLYRSKASKYSPSLMNIGIANIDNITGKSTITQFKREYYKDSCTYDDLERQISIFSPYECIIVAKNIDMDHVTDIAGYVGLSNIKTHIVDLESKTDMAKHALNAEKQLYQNEIINRFFKEEPIHIGNLKIGENNYNIAGVMVSFSPNEIAEHILEKYDVDFVIMINLKGKSVYMRRNKKCTLNMGKLAAKIMDGGGHEDAAGGNLNESIINITKFLKPIN